MKKLPTYADVTTWKDYQGITIDGTYVQHWELGIECANEVTMHNMPSVTYGKVLKQTGDMVYAIILTYDYEKQGIMKLNMNIDKFKDLYYPCPEIKSMFDDTYNKVKLDLQEVIKDYDTSN